MSASSRAVGGEKERLSEAGQSCSMTAVTTYTGGVATTHRIDTWWLQPLLVATGLVTFFGYLTLRAFHPTYVYFEPYISPVVAPPVLTAPHMFAGSVPLDHAWFGSFPAWWPAFIPPSPAYFVPGLAMAFRFTCYYYRGAYYKAFAIKPPNCAVKGINAGPGYKGERGLLIFQNLHRYALYGALVLLCFLWWEALNAFFKGGKFGVGVGTIVMVVNASLLSGYTFGCHSWRHLIGGRKDCFSCVGENVSTTYRMWSGATWLNIRHQLFAWMSLVWVVWTDVYVYLVSSGTIRDLNTWN
jgi:hypothetical protein